MKADELVDMLKAEFSLDDKTQAGVVDEEVGACRAAGSLLGGGVRGGKEVGFFVYGWWRCWFTLPVIVGFCLLITACGV